MITSAVTVALLIVLVIFMPRLWLTHSADDTVMYESVSAPVAATSASSFLFLGSGADASPVG